MKPTIVYNIYDKFFASNKLLMDRNDQLINKYRNNRCFLILSGESISHIDFDVLADEYTFGSNYIFLHPDLDKLNLNFFLCIEAGKHMDKYGHPGSSNFPENLIKSNGKNQGYLFLKESFNKLHNSKTKIFLNHDKIRYYKKTKLFNILGENLFYIKIIPEFNGVNSPKTDLTKRFSVTPGAGALSISIFLLINMGFKEIYLSGTGYTYNPPYWHHFYDNHIFPKKMGEEKAMKAARQSIDIRNKKLNGSLQYYGLLKKDDYFRAICIKKVDKNWAPWVEDRIINQYAESKGVKIINIVPKEFESPVYKKISWQKVVNEVLPSK